MLLQFRIQLRISPLFNSSLALVVLEHAVPAVDLEAGTARKFHAAGNLKHVLF